MSNLTLGKRFGGKISEEHRGAVAEVTGSFDDTSQQTERKNARELGEIEAESIAEYISTCPGSRWLSPLRPASRRRSRTASSDGPDREWLQVSVCHRRRRGRRRPDYGSLAPVLD